MPTTLKIKKGLDLHLIGETQGEITDAVVSTDYAVIPDDFIGLTPKMLKKEGDHVLAGEALFHDKNDVDIIVASPVCGTVKSIKRGARRKIESIEIAADSEQNHLTLSKEELSDKKAALLKSGLWAMMRQRPYGIVPSSAQAPRDIFVSTFDSAPLSQSYTLFIKGREAEFKKGIEILSEMTSGSVYIGCRKDMVLETEHSVTTVFEGPHPAGNVGVQIANTKPVNKGDVVWTVEPETVVKIGKLFTDGVVDFSCIVSITGEMVKKPKIVRTTEGASLSGLLKDNISTDKASRIISGNVLTGKQVSGDDYLHYPYRQITVIPELLDDCEMLGWASLSAKKYSASHTFWSWLAPKSKKYHFDTKINGGERAIIMSGEYDKVFPMDIYAEFLVKAIIARDIDKMEQLGIYEVVPEDFALCEFIDTSKLELQKIVREGLDYLRKEMN